MLYNLHIISKVKPVRYGTETISHLGPKIWHLLPEEYKEIDSLSRRTISDWEANECPCRLRRTYIKHLGFI